MKLLDGLRPPPPRPTLRYNYLKVRPWPTFRPWSDPALLLLDFRTGGSFLTRNTREVGNQRVLPRTYGSSVPVTDEENSGIAPGTSKRSGKVEPVCGLAVIPA